MKQTSFFSAIIMFIVMLFSAGCTSTPRQESTGEYIDDSIITTKVKSAIFNDPDLQSAEINVETYKGIVQLSGFVNSQSDMNKAAQLARGVTGVQSVNNDMRSK